MCRLEKDKHNLALDWHKSVFVFSSPDIYGQGSHISGFRDMGIRQEGKKNLLLLSCLTLFLSLWNIKARQQIFAVFINTSFYLNDIK